MKDGPERVRDGSGRNKSIKVCFQLKCFTIESFQHEKRTIEVQYIESTIFWTKIYGYVDVNEIVQQV